MDNTGGYGIDDAINEYVYILLQVRCSPFTSVLDLGFWVSLQAVVSEKKV